MNLRPIVAILVSCCLSLVVWLIPSPAMALTQLRVFDLDYQSCPAELGEGSVSSYSSLKATCFLILGKVENTSGKSVIDADVFGRVYDANNNPVMQNRSRLGLIPEVPPGISDFQIRISVPENMPAPLSLEKFKASGFSAKVRR